MRYTRTTYFWAIIFVFSSIYLLGKINQDEVGLLEKKPQKLIIHIATIILLLFYAVQTQYKIIVYGFNTDYSYPVKEAEYIP